MIFFIFTIVILCVFLCFYKKKGKQKRRCIVKQKNTLKKALYKKRFFSKELLLNFFNAEEIKNTSDLSSAVLCDHIISCVKYCVPKLKNINLNIYNKYIKKQVPIIFVKDIKEKEYCAIKKALNFCDFVVLARKIKKNCKCQNICKLKKIKKQDREELKKFNVLCRDKFKYRNSLIEKFFLFDKTKNKDSNQSIVLLKDNKIIQPLSIGEKIVVFKSVIVFCQKHNNTNTFVLINKTNKKQNQSLCICKSLNISFCNYYNYKLYKNRLVVQNLLTKEKSAMIANYNFNVITENNYLFANKAFFVLVFCDKSLPFETKILEYKTVAKNSFMCVKNYKLIDKLGAEDIDVNFFCCKIKCDNIWLNFMFNIFLPKQIKVVKVNKYSFFHFSELYVAVFLYNRHIISSLQMYLYLKHCYFGLNFANGVLCVKNCSCKNFYVYTKHSGKKIKVLVQSNNKTSFVQVDKLKITNTSTINLHKHLNKNIKISYYAS